MIEGSLPKEIRGEKDTYQASDELRGKGNAAVVSVVRAESGQPYALKLYRANAGEEQKARFRREAKFLAELDSPYVVPYIDSGTTEINGEERQFLVLGLAEKGSLADYLDDNGSLSVKEGLSKVLPGVVGLEAVHQSGLVHRDVKPGNFLLTDSSTWLTDFDIADIPGKETNFIAGTPSYMAPERLRKGITVPTGDTYAAGATLFYVLSGRLPYFPTEEHIAQSTTVGEEWQIMHAEPQVPSLDGLNNTTFPDDEIPLREALLGRITNTALANDPSDRPTPLAFTEMIKADYEQYEGASFPVHIDLHVPEQQNLASLVKENVTVQDAQVVDAVQDAESETSNEPVVLGDRRKKTLVRGRLALAAAAAGVAFVAGAQIIELLDNKEKVNPESAPAQTTPDPDAQKRTPEPRDAEKVPSPSDIPSVYPTITPSETPFVVPQQTEDIVVYSSPKPEPSLSQQVVESPSPSAAKPTKPAPSETPIPSEPTAPVESASPSGPEIPGESPSETEEPAPEPSDSTEPEPVESPIASASVSSSPEELVIAAQ